jgi:aminopeptidase
MIDPRLRKLANLLVRYSVNVRPGDRVGIRPYGSIAASLALQTELVREVLLAGGHPQPYLMPALADEFDYAFYATASDDQLRQRDRIFELVANEFDCDIVLLCESNTQRLSHVDAERQVLRRRAHAELIRLYYERVARGELRWGGTAYPTAAYAQNAAMSLEEYENFVFAATLADTEDPITLWRDLGRTQQALIDWLTGRKTVRVRGPHVDLRFSIEGRRFMNCDGHLNMPDGEICTTPREDSADGWLESTYPAQNYGIEVGRVTFRFERGFVVRADAEKNQAQLDRLLATDEGARRLGEFGIGTNGAIKVFTSNMLFDEKMAGTIHVAAGAGLPEAGGAHDSAIHWDFLCDMADGGRIIVDDTPFYDSGRFLV